MTTTTRWPIPADLSADAAAIVVEFHSRRDTNGRTTDADYRQARTALMTAAAIDERRADQILTNTCAAPGPAGYAPRCSEEIGHAGCHTWQRWS